jgi:beta-xylosidase
MYKKDGYYYLMIAEGGTELGHMETIARATNITGPYENFEGNPILTARGTSNYFQTVGHADLFQDNNGHWWGVSLATRSGPEWAVYPMGREAVLFPVTWDEGQWPICSEVQGLMNGWPLPAFNRAVPGSGSFNNDPDIVDFAPHSSLPHHFMFFRQPPTPKTFTISPPGHHNTLQIIPSAANLTGSIKDYPYLTGKYGIAFIGRRQTDTLFTFRVDLSFNPRAHEQEAGIIIFLSQQNHIDIGISKHNGCLGLQFRFRVEAQGTPDVISETITSAVPDAWTGPIRLQIQTMNETYYSFAAMPSNNPNDVKILGYAPATILSGGSGAFIGTLVGAYATCNGVGGIKNTCGPGGDAYFSRWRYTGIAQEIAAGVFEPNVEQH